MISFEEAREQSNNYMTKRNEKIINAWCKEAKVSSPIGYYNNMDDHVKIFTDRPGALIGRGGELIKKYQNQFSEEFHKNYSIELIEIRGGFANTTIE